MGSNVRWLHSLNGEKILNTNDKKDKQENDVQNERTGICILSTVNQHHCTKFCNMNVMGSLGTERVDQLSVKRLNKNVKMPVSGTIGAAGYGLSSAENIVIPGKTRAVVKTGLAIGTPRGTYARIAPRSGLAAK